MKAFDDIIKAEVSKETCKTRIDCFNLFLEVFGIEEFYITELDDKWQVEIKIKYFKNNIKDFF